VNIRTEVEKAGFRKDSDTLSFANTTAFKWLQPGRLRSELHVSGLQWCWAKMSNMSRSSRIEWHQLF